MGLFGFLHHNKADKLSRNVDRRAALLRRDGCPLSLERLETGVPGLPIADGDHLAKHVLSADVEAGVTRLSRVEWYAWPDEARELGVQLGSIEDDLAAAISGIRHAPHLRTDLSHVVAQREGDDRADGARAWLAVMPLTKTGRTPKYPVEIYFTTMGGHDATGSHGTVCYLRDGRMGKVDVMYVGRSMSYEAAWRMHDQRLAPAWVYSYDLKSGAQTSVWRA